MIGITVRSAFATELVEEAEKDVEATVEEAVEEEKLWSEDYYRCVDSMKGLSELEQKDLDEICLEFMKNYHADLSLLALTPEYYEGKTLEEMARSYYEDSNFGYGPDKDGFQMIWDRESDVILIEAYGAAEDMIPQDYLHFVAESAPKYLEEYGVYGPMYAVARMLTRYMEDSALDENLAEEAAQSDLAKAYDDNGADGTRQELRVGEGADMPAWYPKDPDNFPKYHDETAPRVVDTADIFSDEQEKQMEQRLTQIRTELSKDIVIFTDVSTYGLSRRVYAADFYDFNGYGCGEDYEGICLFICMDPDDRGWWACCTGEETMGLYTEGIANQIDDILYDYMSRGQYGEGVSDWIENIRRLYLTGSPYLPDWAQTPMDSIERFHDANAPRIVDDAKLLTAQEREELSVYAAEIAQKYDVDVVVLTARDSGSMARSEYAETFYYAGGYGLGKDFDGILLTIFKK
ncbi:MAG: TPM domain-containing protein, partial [Lachnospiraceae bacterium]|nr:TPM domain-containing protein [Lachnospiraceae bacterium]